MLKPVICLCLLTEFSCYFVKAPLKAFQLNGDEKETANYGDIPNYFDWRNWNMVTPVKDQKLCGACWAFSTVASIESHLLIYQNITYSLSEQFLIDCDPNQSGCNDYSILKAFASIVSALGGVLRDADYYPYEGSAGRCRWTKPSEVNANSICSNSQAQPVPVIGYQRVPPNDEEAMAEYLYRYGPLSAAINSVSMAKYYESNYIDEPTEEQCNPKDLNHAVSIVGYGMHVNNITHFTTPYWIVKNSWGVDWGDNGFYYLVRGRNACGIASDVSFPIVPDERFSGSEF